MYKHVKTGCKHIPTSEQPLQFQSGYFLNKPRRCSSLCSSFLYSPFCKFFGIYFSLEYRGVEPKSEAVPTSGDPSIHSSKSTFIGLGPACVLVDQVPFLVWVEPVLPLTLFRKRDCEWLVECISWKHPVRPQM